MKSLRAQIYLWFKKRELRREMPVLKTIETASDFLIHLPKTNPVFALPGIRGLKTAFSHARFWGIGREQERSFLELTCVFDELLFYKTEPKLFSTEYKNLALGLKKKPGVFIDFNRVGSKELALLSQANLRWGFFSEDGYPFFNLLVRNAVDGDEFDRNSALIAVLASVTVDKNIPLTLPLSKKRNPVGVIKSLGERGRRLVVVEGVSPEVTAEMKRRFEAAVIDWTTLKDPQVLSTLVSNCDLFIGGPSVAFELALALRRPIVLISDRELKFEGCDGVVRAEQCEILDQVSFMLTRGKAKRERERLGLCGNETPV
jgi:hypothetical protein